MSKTVPEEVREILETLTGQKAPLLTPVPEAVVGLFSNGTGLGYSQLNELLILLGFDRVTHSFFQFLVDGKVMYAPGAAISDLPKLREGIARFRKIALLLFGNVKFAFKTLSRDAEVLSEETARLEPIPEEEFACRHEPVCQLYPIAGHETYYLGYIIERELRHRLEETPTDTEAQRHEEERKKIVQHGRINHEAYLASDHLDVYVATSMRERHEFMAVSLYVHQIFNHFLLKPLKLRWFDPTQAYCSERIDKGLAEALMLRRAKCTVYFAQETDTLGKDSELASTLAQGKPVIAFVPEVEEVYVSQLLNSLHEVYPQETKEKILLSQLQLFAPDAAWKDATVRKWIEDPQSMDQHSVRKMLWEKIKEHYDRRASTLKETHPLGIQVNLATGVANGVLVVRSVEKCAELVKRILTRTMEFELAEQNGYVLLRELVSGCVFRVTTGDTMLTNAFWNFYLDPSE